MVRFGVFFEGKLIMLIGLSLGDISPGAREMKLTPSSHESQREMVSQ